MKLITTIISILLFTTQINCAIQFIWANEGGEKILKHELRAYTDGINSVNNSIWDGGNVKLFGAKNEVLGFQLILEAPTVSSSNVNVQFTILTGPDNFQIATTKTPPTTIEELDSYLWNWVDRNIELFYVRYLEIKGTTTLSYDHYDERHVPKKLQRPYTINGNGNAIGSGGWTDRPGANKLFPDILVPIELHRNFSIPAGENQAIWCDIFIPKNATSGIYTGTITITEENQDPINVGVVLDVRGFSLPDTFTAKTMLYYGWEGIMDRFVNPVQGYVGYKDAGWYTMRKVSDRSWQMAHRHRISLIDSDNNNHYLSNPEEVAHPGEMWIPRLNGSLFTPEQGYDGPGIGVGNDIYSIGTYGGFNEHYGDPPTFQNLSRKWEEYFLANYPNVERFWYLIDESTNYQQTEGWANIMDGTTPTVKSGATADFTAVSDMPSLDVFIATLWSGVTEEWENAFQSLGASGKRRMMYNGQRPAMGTFQTEDDGVALRASMWGMFKKKIDRWYFWETNYYSNDQGNSGATPLFSRAQTFGNRANTIGIRGNAGSNYANGDGVLMYPGKDLLFQNESYGHDGQFPSLRLKLWRRGLQDVEYLHMAKAINPTAVDTLVNQTVPKMFWEVGETGGVCYCDIGWSIDPEVWEDARRELASIIDSSPPTPLPPDSLQPTLGPIYANPNTPVNNPSSTSTPSSTPTNTPQSTPNSTPTTPNDSLATPIDGGIGAGGIAALVLGLFMLLVIIAGAAFLILKPEKRKAIMEAIKS